MVLLKSIIACLVALGCFSWSMYGAQEMRFSNVWGFPVAHADEGGDGGAGGDSGGGSSDSSGGGGGGDAGVGNDGGMGGPSGEGGGGVGGDTGVGNDGAMGGPAGEGPGDQGVGLGGSPDDSNTDTNTDTNTDLGSLSTTNSLLGLSQEDIQNLSQEEQQEQQTEVAPATPTPETKSFGLLDALANFFGAVVSFAIGTPIGAVVGMVATNVSQLAMGIQTNVERAADLVSSVFSESPGVSPGQPTSSTDVSIVSGEFAGFLGTPESVPKEDGLSGVDTGTPNAFFGTLASLFEDVSVPAAPSLPQSGTVGAPSTSAQPSSGTGTFASGSSSGASSNPPIITFNLDTNFSTLTRILYWTAKEATVCVGTNFSTSGRLSGSVPIANSVDATVSIICGGAGGVAEKTIRIQPLDESAVPASPLTVETVGGNFRVTWDVPTETCVITNTGGFSYRTPSKTGSVDAGPSESGVQFSITCEN